MAEAELTAAMAEGEQKAAAGTSHSTSSGPQNLTLNTHKAGMQGDLYLP